MIRKTSDILPELEYFVKGNNPKLLIHCGTHGDEFESIDIVKKYVEKYEVNLPDFVFVPVVSPSAVKSRTRFNKNGKDLNRIFFSDSTEIEVRENANILDNYKFDLMVSFHEDPENDSYYIYDEGLDINESVRVLAHNQKIKQLGMKLLNGVDDPNDPHLGHKFVDGYNKLVIPKDYKNNGMATVWAIAEKKTKNSLTAEIPGKLSIKQKEIIVDTFFRDVLKTEESQ